MKTILLTAIAAGAVLAAAAPADARGGCGIGFHRGPYGGCRRNLGPGPVVVAPAPVVVAPGALVVGTYYPRRGWWDGRRYWWHRDRWHGGWRYR